MSQGEFYSLLSFLSEDLESAKTLDSGYVVICMFLAGANVLSLFVGLLS